jgi:signal transduction histidine kinase
MFETLRLLFDTSDFPARWHCGNWTATHGWVHILSDLSIASAYAMIPLAIASYCWVKRTELAFPKVLWLFAAFIFSCGSVHLVEAIIFWFPMYRFAALLKIITAVVSWGTVIAIIRVAPQALELPGLRRINNELQEQLVISREAGEALDRSNRDLQSFTGIVSHDLKNPISGALFMAELAKESSDAGDVQLASTQMNIVLESLREMNRFVTDLHSEAMSRKAGTDLAPLSLVHVLETVLKKLAPMLESARATVKIGNLPRVFGNETLLLQLFSNLIENAVKYRSEENPAIHIHCTSEAGSVIIRVEDNGRGIPIADRVAIFDPQVRARNAGGVSGSGLGLSLCRRIMESHHGTIEISDSSEAGTTFILRLPQK